eukprot:NODE_7373_length_572_cov_2.479924_g6361_i0.p3 GENE.NODE_7373_length_572_cov_2.479924_g6361_i0~~NODE_7373_length_572_cov_2.479924_g6361_i0.p3  ORF type:complete len:59 (+),score=9.39 NODE_7373_length_572_cov_2.479924_g6361_i0:89-265(+)
MWADQGLGLRHRPWGALGLDGPGLGPAGPGWGADPSVILGQEAQNDGGVCHPQTPPDL